MKETMEECWVNTTVDTALNGSIDEDSEVNFDEISD